MQDKRWKQAGVSLGRWAAIAVIALALAAITQVVLEPSLSSIEHIWSWQHLRLVVANALPVACFGLLIFALTARPAVSTGITLLLLIALHTANNLKLLNLGLPLLPADFHFLQGGHGEGGLLSQYLSWSVMWVPIMLLLATGAAIWLERRRRAVGPRMRIAVGATALIVTVTLFFGTPPWKQLYNRWAMHFEPWSPAKTNASAGMAPSLLMFHWELAKGVRPPKDRSAAKHLIAQRADSVRKAMRAEAGQNTLPDIIVVQSESFFDPELMRGMPKGRTIQNFHALAERGTSGNLTVPTFGGGTIRTEFEVLTGIALKYFPTIQYPYFELMDRPLPSLPRTLGRAGYKLEAIHPNSAGFWNRARALHQIGIDHFVAGAEFPNAPKVGLFVSDSALTDRIEHDLHDDGPPQLLFAISMEAHGPYEFRPGLDPKRLAALPVPPGLNAYGEHTLRNYLYHLQDADQELGRLAKVLMTRKRPTLLLFYGDHLPGLYSTYAQAGFVDGRIPQAQPTPWLLLDNRTHKVVQEDLHAWQLPVRLLAVAGVREDAYFALIGSLHDAIAAMDNTPDIAFSDALGEIVQLRLANQFDALASATLDETPPQSLNTTGDAAAATATN